jgi:hypothetical protein
MTLDLSKVLPGDEVTAHYMVESPTPGGFYVRANRATQTTFLPAGYVTGHTPKALSVGDRVRSRNAEAEVLAMRGGDACIVFAGTDELALRPIRMLERIP